MNKLIASPNASIGRKRLFILNQFSENDFLGSFGRPADIPAISIVGIISIVLSRRTRARFAVNSPALRAYFLKGLETDGFDLYSDGVLQAFFTPGHTPGHQSFIVSLPSGNAFTLAIDAAYTLDHFYDKALPGLMTSASEAARSVAKLRTLTEMHNAEIIPGHDPDIWPRYVIKTEGYN